MAEEKVEIKEATKKAAPKKVAAKKVAAKKVATKKAAPKVSGAKVDATKSVETKKSPVKKAVTSKPTVSVTLVKSFHGRLPKHRATVTGLGLKRINHTVVLEDTPEVRGMISKVSYLLKVEG